MNFIDMRKINIFAVLTFLVFISTAVSADNPREQLRKDFDRDVSGKTVAWVPITLGNPLGDMWTAAMRRNFEKYGVEFIVRDPNFDSNAQLQAVTSLINQNPDVLIVQNPNVSLLASQLKKAMEQGIYVVQVNMTSNQRTDAYVGVDYIDVGRIIARDIVSECGNGSGSGKVAIVQGEATAAGSVDQLQGAMEIFDKHDSIDVVSTQAANWDSNKAFEITSTVLQQHPDLCATYGFWGIMQQGAARAVAAAGKQDQVKVYASSEGNASDCELVEKGLFHKILSFRADAQGEQIVNAVTALLQGDEKPGEQRFVFLSNNYWVSGKEDRRYCFTVPESS